jgi:hypothetical protein
VIAEHEIDTVFDDRAIAQLLVRLKRSPSAKLFTETDRQRFTDSIHMAVRCYLAEHARTNWPVIAKQVRTLYRLLEKAEGGNARAVAELAKQLDATDAATRGWLERCVYRELVSVGRRDSKQRNAACCHAPVAPDALRRLGLG